MISTLLSSVMERPTGFVRQLDGLRSLPVGTGAEQVQDMAVGAAPTSLFWMEDVLAMAEGEGATPTGFLINPLDAAMLGRIPSGTGSAVPLLGSDPANPRVRTISGVPLLKVPALPRGTAWLVDGTRVRTVIRRDARIDVSSDAYFRKDGLAVKASARATFAFPHPRSLVRVRFAAAA